MVQSVCDTGAQADTWCPSTTDEVLPSVLGLLPHGPAWEASQVKGTVMNMFWRSVAAALAYLHLRLCAYVPEFFCATVVESRDQWNAEYGIGIDSCDPYGYSLCAKETTLGTSTSFKFSASDSMALSRTSLSVNALTSRLTSNASMPTTWSRWSSSKPLGVSAPTTFIRSC